MARYIDADLLHIKMEDLYEHHIEMRNYSADGAVADCLDMLDKTPTADVVEVVRCKDCVKDNRFDCPLCYIEKQTLQFINHDAEFYCGYGERRNT